VALTQESERRAHTEALLVCCHARLGQRRQHLRILPHHPRSHFHERQGAAVISDQNDLALRSAWYVVSCDEHIAVAAQVPKGVRLSADSGAASAHFFLEKFFD
jgi:hypothetical protein